MSDLDLSYTPPLSSPWDGVQVAALALPNRLKLLVIPTGIESVT